MSNGSAYGWRARIGMLQPSKASDTNPYEFYLMAPPGVQLIITSLGLGGLNQTEYNRAVDNIAGPIELLLDRGAQVIVQAGVPPVVTHGWGFAEELAARVAKLTPRPFITDASASIQAMQALGLSRIVQLGNAFSPELIEHVRRYFASAGIEVLQAQQIAVPPGTHSGNLPLETVYQAAKTLYQRHAGKAEGIWLTQAAVPSVGVIDALERDLGVSVATSAQAMMWSGLRLAGVDGTRITGYGRLFSLGGRS